MSCEVSSKPFCNEHITKTCVSAGAGAFLACLALKTASIATSIFTTGGMLFFYFFGYIGVDILKDRSISLFEIGGLILGMGLVTPLMIPTGGNFLLSMAIGIPTGIATRYFADQTTRKITQLV
jgi:hypothetical protein